MSEWKPDRTRNRIAVDLREIEQLAVELHWQMMAVTTDGEPNTGKMLGGDALNMLAPAAIPQDWDEQYATVELDLSAREDYAYEQVGLDEHPINLLGFWTRVIREEREQPTDLKPTISREVDYLRKNIGWMTRTDEHGEPEWFEVTEVETDLHKLRRKMEDVLKVGDRLDTSATACFNLIGAEARQCGGRLVRATLRRRECEHAKLAGQIAEWLDVLPGDALRGLFAYRPDLATEHRGCDQGGRDDVYRCLDCERKYTSADYWLAVRQGYEREVGA